MGGVRREVLLLVAAVLVVDAGFIALYFLAGLRHGSSATKLGFTVVWTILTLLVVVWGWSRVRSARGRRSRTQAV